MSVLCDSCKFYHELDRKENFGQCRKYAPKPHPVNREEIEENLIAVVWPVIGGDEWCGEFQRKFQG